jgi:hypothetical protein
VKTRVLLPVVLAMLAIAAAVAPADEVSDAIVAAQGAYARADYKEASVELETALAGVNEKLSDLITNAMPVPPAGWTVTPPRTGTSASALGLLTGLVVERTYTAPDGSEIELTIETNPPQLSGLRMYFSNPKIAVAMGSQDEMKKIKICDRDALEQFTSDSTDIQILAGNVTLISVSGEDSSDRDFVRALANATNCQAIVNTIE